MKNHPGPVALFRSILPIVFFIPGYYGSHLRDVAENKQIYLTPSNFLSLKPLEKLDNKEYTAEIIKDVSVGPITEHVYGPAVRNLNKMYGESQVRAFGYDWRSPLDSSADKFTQYVNQHWDKKSPVMIIGHSMGCLLFSHWIQRAENQKHPVLKNIQQVNLVTGPLMGSAALLRNLTIGTPFPYAPWLLVPENLWTYATPFHLLPDKVEVIDGDKTHTLNLTEAKTWKELVLPRLSFNVSDDVLNQKIDYIKGTRRAVSQLLHTKTPFKIKVIVAESGPTTDKFFLEDKKLTFDVFKVFGWMFAKRISSYYAPGDGTVTVNSQGLGDAFKNLPSNFELRTLKADHLKVLENPESIKTDSL